MDEKRLQEQITQAVETHCAHLRTDPFLAAKVLGAANRKETVKVKRKMSAGLVLAIVLMLLTVTAVAAAILSGMELIDLEAIPLAQGNDRELRPVEEYTLEELQSIVALAAENGIILDDDTSVMRALRLGEGYSEEETIMTICREAFGGLYYEWSVEQRYWFEEKMVEIGWSKANDNPLPGEGDMSTEEARALATQLLQAEYGAELPLNDPALYRWEIWFTPDDGQTDAAWSMTLRPRTLSGDIYYISFDAQGGNASMSTEPLLVENYGLEYLRSRMVFVYGYWTGGLDAVPAEGWYDFGQMIPLYVSAEEQEIHTGVMQGHLLSQYLLPGEGDIPVRQAREIAFADAGVKDYLNVTEVLLGKDAQRIWKIAFQGDEANGARPLLSYEIDAASGEILRRTDMTHDYYEWARYMLDETYQTVTAGEDVMTAANALELACSALHKALGNDTVPFMDPAYYTAKWTYLESDGRYNVTFATRVMEYPTCSAWVHADGSVEIRRKGEIGVNGDNLFDRMIEVYGADSDWTQDMWVMLDQEMDKYEPATFEGRLFKQASYPDASTVKITREQALDIAYQDITDQTTWEIRCLLIGAEPNPVWKIRMAWDPMDILYEIDAMTGEILDREYYGVQMPAFDHTMKMYTLHKDYMPAALAEFGVARVAMELCVKANLEALGEYPDAFTNTEAYVTEVDGMTVTFHALQGGSSYRVTVAEDGMDAEIEVLEANSVLPPQEGGLESLYAMYGSDRKYWPLEAQYAHKEEYDGLSLPKEGEMTYEEALEHALELLRIHVGQEAIDALGRYTVGCQFTRHGEDGKDLSWFFYITDNPQTEENGWKVVFFLHDDVLSPTYQIQHVSETGNG